MSAEADARLVGYHPSPWRERIKHGVYQIVETVIARTSGLSYFACAGTLLGMVKYQAMIPWDDDADLGIFLSDLEAWRRVFATTGYRVTETIYGFILSDPSSRAMVDFFVFDRLGEQWRLCYPLVSGRPTFGMSVIRCYEMSDSELHPLSSRPYGHLTLPIPCGADAICTRLYGPNYRTEAKRPDHGFGCHVIWPELARTIQPLCQGLVTTIEALRPHYLAELAEKKAKKKKIRT